MIDKPLYIMTFMWCVSLSVLGGQYVIADVLGIDLVNYNGVAIKSHILTLFDQNDFNTRAKNIVSANFTGNTTYYNKVETFTTGAAYVAWELVTLASGTYIFNFLYLMGVDLFFIVILVMVFLILLARSIVGWVRGI